MAEQESQQVPENAEPTTSTDSETTGDVGKVFTQADVDGFVKDRLERERKATQKKIADQYGNYDELKQMAERLQQIEDANKSEVEKAAAKAAKLEKQLVEIQGENARLAKERINSVRRASVLTTASKLGFADPSDAWRFVNLDTLEVGDDDEVKGVAEALAALAESKPYLLGQKTNPPKLAPTSLPTGGGQDETDEHRRQRLFGAGDSPFGRHGGGVYSPKTE